MNLLIAKRWGRWRWMAIGLVYALVIIIAIFEITKIVNLHVMLLAQQTSGLVYWLACLIWFGVLFAIGKFSLTYLAPAFKAVFFNLHPWGKYVLRYDGKDFDARFVRRVGCQYLFCIKHLDFAEHEYEVAGKNYYLLSLNQVVDQIRPK